MISWSIITWCLTTSSLIITSSDIIVGQSIHQQSSRYLSSMINYLPVIRRVMPSCMIPIDIPWVCFGNHKCRHIGGRFASINLKRRLFLLQRITIAYQPPISPLTIWLPMHPLLPSHTQTTLFRIADHVAPGVHLQSHLIKAYDSCLSTPNFLNTYVSIHRHWHVKTNLTYLRIIRTAKHTSGRNMHTYILFNARQNT